MNFTNTTTYKVTFSIESFEATEGGMDHSVFAEGIETMEEAISDLEIADKVRSGEYWAIICNVSKTIKGSKS